MIQSKTKKVWTASDGSEHETMEQAQKHDLAELLGGTFADVELGMSDRAADYIVQNSSEVLDILLTDGRRRKRLGKTTAKRTKKPAEKPQENTTTP